jgi:telomerase reverse transcriptase
VLSSLLGNFYYGALEKELFNADEHVDSNNGHVFFLVRIIDDYLLVTTDKAMHQSFLQVMQQGKPSLGMNINRDKMYSSVPVSLKDSDGTCHQLEGASANGLFPWCGMLFDTRSCEVRIDCARFAAGRAADNLTVARGAKAGEHLRTVMKTFVRPRCIPILFDPAINCQRTIDMNFFDLMLICAVKTEAYIASSSMMDSPYQNGNFLHSCMQEVILFALQLIKHRNRVSLQQEACKLDMTRRMALSLGWNAFFFVFRRGQYLRSFMAQIKKQIRSCSSSPRIRSVVFWAFSMMLVLNSSIVAASL